MLTASAFKSRAAYDWSVETSIYVSRDLRSSGVGSLLYEKLEEYLTAQHVCQCLCLHHLPQSSQHRLPRKAWL